MKKWKLAVSPMQSGGVLNTARLIGAIGQGKFSQAIFECLRAIVPVSHFSLYAVFPDRDCPELLSVGSHNQSDSSQRAVSYYINQGFYRDDRALELVRKARSTETTFIQLPTNEIPLKEWRGFCYEQFDVRSRLSMICTDELTSIGFYANFFTSSNDTEIPATALSVLHDYSNVLKELFSNSI